MEISIWIGGLEFLVYFNKGGLILSEFIYGFYWIMFLNVLYSGFEIIYNELKIVFLKLELKIFFVFELYWWLLFKW